MVAPRSNRHNVLIAVFLRQNIGAAKLVVRALGLAAQSGIVNVWPPDAGLRDTTAP